MAIDDRLTFERKRMVEKIAARGVCDKRVLRAMLEVPRHLFVPEHLRSQAYGDHALPIGRDQTISQPYVVALMSELLDVHADHSVLEIGTGTGYQTLILSKLARVVYSMERIGTLAQKAIDRLRTFGLDNVKIQAFDGTIGWSSVGPFDRILVTAGAPRLPEPLLEQLKTPGKLVVPEGDRRSQRLVLYHKTENGVSRQVGDAVLFVPLIGRHGWRPSTDGKH